MSHQSIDELAKSIRTMLCGLLIAEYGLRSVPDTKFELKQRVNAAIRKCLDVQDYFLYNRNARPEIKKLFQKEFLKNELVLLTEIMETIYGLPEADLEMILNSLKENIAT